MKRDISSGRAGKLLDDDRRAMNVSFLTLAYVNERTGKGKAVGNVFTAAEHEQAVEELADWPLTKKTPVDILEYFERHRGFAVPAKEIAEVFAIPEEEAKSRLRELAQGGLLETREWAFGATTWSSPERVAKEKLTVGQVKAAHVTGPTQVPEKARMNEIIVKAVEGLYTQVANDPHKTYHFPLGRKAFQHWAGGN